MGVENRFVLKCNDHFLFIVFINMHILVPLLLTKNTKLTYSVMHLCIYDVAYNLLVDGFLLYSLYNSRWNQINCMENKIMYSRLTNVENVIDWSCSSFVPITSIFFIFIAQ